jgi:tetratricopeptide (TPR) repeat protein
MKTSFQKLLLVFVLSIFAVNIAISQDNKEKGINAVKSKDYVKGIELLKTVVDKDKSYETNFYYALALLYTGSFNDAEKYFKVALQDDDEGVNALIGLGDIKLETKNYDAAIAYFDKALKIEPTNVPALVDKAKAYLAKGKIDKGIELLTNAQINDPNNAEILVALGDAYYERDTYPVALDNYNKALKLNPKLASAYFGIARTYTKQARIIEDVDKKQAKYNQALEAYDKAIAADQKFAEAYYEKAFILYAAGKYDVTVDEMKKYVALRPNSVKGKYLYARALYRMNSYDDAATVMKSIATSDTAYASLANLYLAKIYSERPTKDSVVQADYYQNALKYYALVKPEDIEYSDILSIANIYAWQGNSTEALNNFNKAIAKEPDNYEAYYEMGKYYFNTEKYDLAAETFEKAKAKGMKTSVGFLYTGLTYNYLKNYEQAISNLQASISIKPNGLTYLYIAKSYRAMNNKELAIENYKNVLKLEPDNQEAIEALKVLESQTTPTNGNQ